MMRGFAVNYGLNRTRPLAVLAALTAAVCFCRINSSAALGQESLLQLGGAGSAESEMVKAAGYFTAPAGGKPALLVVSADVAPGWHIYSLTQQPGGPVKSKIKLAQTADFKIAGDFKPLKPADVHRYEDIYPSLPVEEHQGHVVWVAPIDIAAGVDPAKLEIAGAVNAQVCSTSCLAPKDYKFVARLGKASPEIEN